MSFVIRTKISPKEKLTLFLIFTFSLCIQSCSTSETRENKSKQYELWYEQPASYFEESLVIGNGRMGASIFGGVEIDSMFLNESTLWSGEPINPDMNSNAYEYLPKVRKALQDENYQEADRLIKNIQGSFSQSYAPLGTLYFEYDHPLEEVKKYKRSLDISNAISKVSYQIKGVNFTRNYFISHPDKVMIIKIESDQLKSLNFNIDFSSLLRTKTEIDQSIQKTNGYAPYHAEPSYRGNIENPIRFDKNRGIHFSNYVKIKDTDGKIKKNGQKLQVTDASYAEVIVSTATSFNGFEKDPVLEGKPYQKITLNQLENTAKKSYSELKKRHLGDYHSFFNRLQLVLQPKDSLRLPTDQRLMRYAEGEKDKGLEELYFHFGRYLLISSSRTPEVPANLQGIWNPYLRPPWSSNYTLNINAEENYWLAETANLSELHYPLLSFIENLEKTGQISAANFYNAKGWSVGHNSDIWAMSNPVGDFGEGHPVWANWNMGGAWLSTHLWEHYSFTQDLEFLKEKAYPLMKGAAEFCMDMLIRDQNGKWVSSPTTSPENMYLTPKGYSGATLYGATADLAIIRELFSATAQAAQLLQVDPVFEQKLLNYLEELHPYQIGKNGQLLEWYHDWDDTDPKHRHQSHLFGLYPGMHINPEKTPELAEASKKTLNIKGDKSTGWSQGWRINLWARLKDGNRAHKLYKELLTFVDPSGLNYNYTNGGGTYPNLLDAHPPFQIDGNFGGAAGVLEMLIQSSNEQIELLPALPDTWSEGNLQGVKTRGGFELDFKWFNNQVSQVRIRSSKDGSTTVLCKDQEYKITLEKGEEILLDLDS
tara:strand:+ start:42573 stop:45035 length:2463 start_codon:yes stop_codon:yes gene_type:complete